MSSNPAVAPPSSGRNRDADRSLDQQALLLTWLGQEPISFNRAYVDVTGNALSALWLSHVIDQMPAVLREGRGTAQGNAYTFAMTGQECQQATGITRAQQMTCRRQLADAGILSEEGTGHGGRAVRYTVHLDQLRVRLRQAAEPLRQALEQQQAWQAPQHRARRPARTTRLAAAG